MKKQQNNSTRAWALHVALAIALLSISAALVASSFKPTPATSGLIAPTKPVTAGDKDLVIAGPASSQSLSPADAPFTFIGTGALGTAREFHTATLLSNGKVLVAGGFGASGFLASAELYDPATGMWSGTGALATAREFHTATLLPNGKVLVAGGIGAGGVLASAELYDPTTGTWSATGSLNYARGDHTATLLPNGKVLVAGGKDNSTYVESAELYDPATGMWSSTFTLPRPREAHTATLLPNGKVLVAGGHNANTSFDSAALYDPATGMWSDTSALGTAREFHTATLLPNGKVLVAGGGHGNGYVAIAELYDPATGSWNDTGALATARLDHTATLLPNGKVLVAGGRSTSGVLASAELYDPANGTWSGTGALASARYDHTATLLPDGKVLVAGGFDNAVGYLASAELYDPANGTWSGTGALVTARDRHTATLVPNGKVLVAGGGDSSGALASAELYDPATGMWSGTGALATARVDYTATLLPNGKVLVAGGVNRSGVLASAELYDPAIGMWSGTGALATERVEHTATLLPNGKVLVAGGQDNSRDTIGSAELYDPANGMWSGTGALGTAREFHTATLLPNGKVLVAGGFGPSGVLASAELYDPATGMWSGTGALVTARDRHTATLLPNGKVLVAGGQNSSGDLVSAELYDPANGSWSATGSLNSARDSHTATLLPNGEVLVAGGSDGGATAELYYPADRTWSATGDLNNARRRHTATLLLNGKVLVAGGDDSSAILASAELYDVGLGFVSPAWQPQIAVARSPLLPAGGLKLTGSRFQGISQASGGNFQDSSTNYPVVQLRSIDNSQVTFLPVDPTTRWSDTSFNSAPLNNFPLGPALVTVFTNGIPSNAKYVLVALTEPCDSGLIINGGFEAGTFASWVIDGTANPPLVMSTNPHSGTFSALAGNLSGGEPLGDSSFYQQFVVPASGGTLSFWHWDLTTDNITYDWQDAYITNTSGTILQTIFHQCEDGQTWVNTMVDMAAYSGQTVRIKFLVHQDGFGDDTGMYVDDVQLLGPCGSPSPTPTATATPTATPTPPGNIQVTVQTSPAGLAFSVDGTPYSSTQTFSWVSGSSHTIGTTSPQSGGAGVQYLWTNWSGGGGISHNVAPTTNTTYTASFSTQYYLTMSSGAGGTVSPNSGWKNSGAAVSIRATPAKSYSFTNWTGSGSGSYSGTNNPASITMNGPITETATFAQNLVQVTVQTNPAGLAFSVDGTSYSSTQTFSWVRGSSHTIATTSPQSGGTGVQYVWANWSGGGGISHNVSPTSDTTYTANFTTQYYLTMAHGTGGNVTPASGWKNSGVAVSIKGNPAGGYSFTNWTGSGTGSYSGTTNPASITMGGPITETATFTHH